MDEAGGRQREREGLHYDRNYRNECGTSGEPEVRISKRVPLNAQVSP